MHTLNIVIPCYNESNSLPLFYDEVTKCMNLIEDIKYSLLFIDDGSSDTTLQKIKELAKEDTRVNYISFSRNFGKEAAIYAGLENTHADYIVVMDADLQDPPKLLPQMLYALREEAYDSVATRRVSRKGEPPIRSFFAKKFYSFINTISETEIVDGARDYRMMTKQFALSLLELKEYNRFSKGLYSWVGYKTKWIEFENVERVAGETKWSFWKLFLYALEGIMAFSTLPLAIASFIGFIFCLLAFIAIVFIVVRTLIFGDPVSGWPSTVSIMLFVGGVQLLCTGILGQYLSRLYLESKKRPIYIAKETHLDT